MRKRAISVGAGLVAVALLLIAPGVASADVLVPWGGQFGNVTEATPPTIPLHAGGPVAPGGQFGNITEATPPATIFAGGVLVPWGGQFGNVTIETAPALPFSAGVWVPWGGQFGNVMIDTPPATPFSAGVYVPLGSRFGNLGIPGPGLFRNRDEAASFAAGLTVSSAPPPFPKFFGSNLRPLFLDPEPLPGPLPRFKSCYQGACPATVLGGTGPSESIWGSDSHSYGPQQAIRQGVIGSGFAITIEYRV